MGKTKQFQEEINLTFQKLEELHPYMSLMELNHLVNNVVHYKNKALIHQDNIELRKSNPIIYGVIEGEMDKKIIKAIEEDREL